MNLRPTLLLTTLIGLCLAAPGEGLAPRGTIHADVPEKPNAAQHWLIYAHGHIVEMQGREAESPEFGRYEYDAILKALAERGFEVVSEVRKPGSGPSFAARLAQQVGKLRAAGVPAEHITVVGASRGGFYTLSAAAELQQPGLSFVALAACGDATVALAPRLRGRVLSIYDAADKLAPSCAATFAVAKQLQASREIVVTLGRGHGLLYRPYAEWLEPTAAWALGTGEQR